ncbi:hypothetical protein Q4575_06580 [Psychrosphaera sp. 1_MG-2023]|uniref:hypothetical protein n=1 Tax=Psychrosphaera sp. 1_MG-2023 TaxID=3062643 RepID=UPI0026E15CD6|nr:hypothetical protein [Psychrosphaera sp. 1_MG-2023]MDO6719060.1 hypothetical protein [Psychrosphaera sp. 1_MG-2023]
MMTPEIAELSTLQIAFYATIFLQVLITTILIPTNIYRTFVTILSNFALEHQSKSTEISARDIKFAKASLTIYLVLSVVIALFSTYVVLSSYVEQKELLNWDNQAGAIVLFFLAILPVITLALLNRSFLKHIRQSVSSLRSASLSPLTWRDFMSPMVIILLAIGQLTFIGATAYFTLNPFDGFGGMWNILGLVFLNSVMGFTVYSGMNNRGLSTIANEHERLSAKKLIINVNVFIWVVASYYLTLSLLLAGFDLKSYSLVLQSIYLQIIFIAMIKAFKVGEYKALDANSQLKSSLN